MLHFSAEMRVFANTNELDEAHGFVQDNPAVRGWPGGEEWIRENPRKITAYYKKHWMLDPKKLLELPGERGEHRFLDDLDYERADYHRERLQELVESMQEEGYDPKHPVAVWVEADGKPVISEGNHRVRAAAQAGISKIPVEVKYFGGGEEVEGRWHPSEAM